MYEHLLTENSWKRRLREVFRIPDYASAPQWLTKAALGNKCRMIVDIVNKTHRGALPDTD